MGHPNCSNLFRDLITGFTEGFGEFIGGFGEVIVRQHG